MGTPGPREMCDYNWCDCENVTKFLGDLVYTARVAEDEIRKRYTPAEARALIVMCTKHHGLHRPLGYCYDEEKCKKIKEDVHDFWSIIFGFKKGMTTDRKLWQWLHVLNKENGPLENVALIIAAFGPDHEVLAEVKRGMDLCRDELTNLIVYDVMSDPKITEMFNGAAKELDDSYQIAILPDEHDPTQVVSFTLFGLKYGRTLALTPKCYKLILADPIFEKAHMNFIKRLEGQIREEERKEEKRNEEMEDRKEFCDGVQYLIKNFSSSDKLALATDKELRGLGSDNLDLCFEKITAALIAKVQNEVDFYESSVKSCRSMAIGYKQDLEFLKSLVDEEPQAKRARFSPSNVRRLPKQRY